MYTCMQNKCIIGIQQTAADQFMHTTCMYARTCCMYCTHPVLQCRHWVLQRNHHMCNESLTCLLLLWRGFGISTGEDGLAESLLKLTLVAKVAWHQKIKQRPQVHNVILQRRANEHMYIYSINLSPSFRSQALVAASVHVHIHSLVWEYQSELVDGWTSAPSQPW